MRDDATDERITSLLAELGRYAQVGDRLYLTGGATAVLVGWRRSTRAVDIRLEGGEDALLRAIAELKDRLSINIELASPLDFLPEVAGWRDRCPYVGRFGALEVFDMMYELQALSKLQRAFDQDLEDVREMLARQLTSKTAILAVFEHMRSELFRFPAVDEPRLAKAVDGLPAFPSAASQ
jgi:hypothetical protein